MKDRQTLAAVLTLLLSLAIFWGVTQMTRAMFGQLGSQLVAAVLVECLAIGVIVMASIQTVRGVVPVRGAFHRERMIGWMSYSPEHREALGKRVVTAMGKPVEIPEPEQALDTLLDLITTQTRKKTDGDRLAFFDLPLEQLCGQIGVGAERAIIDPSKHAPMLMLLAGSGGTDDAIQLLSDDAAQSQAVTFPEGVEPEEKPRIEAEVRAARQDAFMRSRSKLEERVRRNIDWLQIDTAHAWRWRLRVVAIVLAAAMGLLSSVASQEYWAIPASMAVAGVVGGFFATVSRDLVAIVERLRR